MNSPEQMSTQLDTKCTDQEGKSSTMDRWVVQRIREALTCKLTDQPDGL